MRDAHLISLKAIECEIRKESQPAYLVEPHWPAIENSLSFRILGWENVSKNEGKVYGFADIERISFFVQSINPNAASRLSPMLAIRKHFL
jgi:hypothetical protein